MTVSGNFFVSDATYSITNFFLN